MKALRNEPILVLTLVVPVLGLLAAFGASLTAAQITAVGTVVAAVTSILARRQVTPGRKAATKKGTAS